ncbi:MAG: hypothetical protein M1820_001163 [Bogoriella megaspora]|nr:MAG: hypothetical protein M1820_001163 [Bogoriella megaspora]
MSASNPAQLLLLADHIKLSLLERQRALSLNIEGDQKDGHISRSLETLREGIEALEREQNDLSSSSNASQISSLRTQYLDLQSQFQGWPSTHPISTLTSPNNPSLTSDFNAAQQVPSTTSTHASSKKQRHHPRTSSLKRGRRTDSPTPKSVRFTDSPSHSGSSSADSSPDPNRSALFPYRDDPVSDVPDQSDLSNQQIHAYHSRVLADQDEQLDTLGQSISRQRELSIQIGDELEGHVALLDEVDESVDRHQSSLDRARRRLGGVARRARENWGMTTIVVLIVVLVLLIIILK